MPKQRFTEEQMIRMLREAEAPGEPIRDVCRKYGMAEQTCLRWRRKYGGLEVAEAVRLRQLERENARFNQQHPRYGYRRVCALLPRRGVRVNY